MDEKMNSKLKNNDLLMLSVSRFFKQKSNLMQMLPVITGKSRISLRLLDWFVTNYSKKKSTNIIVQTEGNNIMYFNVFLSYKAQLKAYSKHHFDPFRRRDRISFYYEKDKFIETTIGQLNFFRWAIQNNILEYLNDHSVEIEEDMLNMQKNLLTEKNIRKRTEISHSFVKNMNRSEGVRIIKFD